MPLAVCAVSLHRSSILCARLRIHEVRTSHGPNTAFIQMKTGDDGHAPSPRRHVHAQYICSTAMSTNQPQVQPAPKRHQPASPAIHKLLERQYMPPNLNRGSPLARELPAKARTGHSARPIGQPELRQEAARRLQHPEIIGGSTLFAAPLSQAGPADPPHSPPTATPLERGGGRTRCRYTPTRRASRLAG